VSKEAMMPKPTHAELVEKAVAWLRRNGFGAVTSEITAYGSRERPDAIGFRETCSAIVEVKASRADFLADAAKPERSQPETGIGTYRFFLSPPGVISVADLLPGWGLLHADGRKIVPIDAPLGNLWPPFGKGSEIWRGFQHPVNAAAERAVLYSIARRLSKERGVST
jgi:hypothetical protein